MNKNQFTQVFSLIIFSFIALMAIRLTLYNFYIEDFKDLTDAEFYASLFMGFRVDMITIFTFSVLFILPLLFIKRVKVRVSIAMLWAMILNIIFIISFSDVLYFDFTHRHISDEIFNLGNDIDLITGMVFGSMFLFTLGALLLSIIFLFLVYKLFSSKLKNFIDGKKLFIYTFIVVIVIFLGIRNNLAGKSFGSGDAYAVNKVSSGN